MNVFKSIVVWFTGLSFMVVLFPLTSVIWLLVLPFDRDRIVTHWLLTYQSFFLSHILPIWKIDIEGREKAVSGATYVIISNHQSILDILLLNCLRYKYKWISKIENGKIPVLGWYLKMAGYITVNRSNEESKAEMVEQSLRTLKKGISIMIFPEGTRSVDSEISFFKRGAFQLATETKISILPVIIDGTGGILPKHGLILGSSHNIRIRVLDPVLPSSFNDDTPEELAIKLRLLMKRELKDLRKNINVQ
jgi:1-acyl-sn-glycerol-3-phosphate acyltransferase